MENLVNTPDILRQYEELGCLGSIEFSTRDGILYASPGLKKILNFTDQSIFQNFSDFHSFIDQHSRTGNLSYDPVEWPNELRLGFSNGRRMKLKVLCKKDGDNYSIAFKDITGKANDSSAIEDDSQFLQTILNMSPAGVIVLRPFYNSNNELVDFTIILSNSAADKINNIRLQGRNYTDVFKVDIATDLMNNYKELLHNNRIMDREEWISDHEEGRWFRFLAGRMGQDILVSFEDITTRKEAEENFKKASVQLKAVFSGAHVQISYLKPKLDAYGNIIDFTVELFNKINHRMYRNRNGNRTKLLTEIMPHITQHEIFRRLKEVLSTKQPAHFETYYSQDASNTWLDVSLVYHEEGVISSALNITDSKDSAIQMQESRNLLQSVLNASLSGIIYYRSLRENGKIVDFEMAAFNQGAGKFLEQNKITSRQMLKQFPGFTRSGILEEFIEVVEENKPIDDEMFYQDEDVDMWVHRRAVKLEDGLVLSWEDITERKIQDIMIKEQLKEITESQELLNAVFNSSLSSITVFKNVYDGQGILEDFELLLSNDSQEIPVAANKEKRVLGSVSDEKARDLFRLFQNVAETGESIEKEVLIGNNSHTNWFRLTAVRIPGGIVATFDNITERKKAEVKLKQQESELRSLVENTPDLISRWNSDLNLVFSNSAFDELSKQSHQTIFGKKIDELGISAIQPFPNEQVIKEVFSSGLAKDHFSTVILPNESVQLYSILIPEPGPDGTIETVLSISRDITEIRHVEEELRDHNQKLMESRQSLQRKDHFIRIASHELKTPITAMYGYVQILLEKYEKSEDSLLSHSLHVINRQVEKLTKLITELLDITKVDTNTLRLHPEIFDLSLLLSETLEFLQASSRHQLIFEK